MLKLSSQPRGPTIVYCTAQLHAAELAAELARVGFPAKQYHAGMEAEERKRTQDWFMDPQNDTGIVCATIAFGMGIDKHDIRYVYHFCPPKSLEGYAQVR